MSISYSGLTNYGKVTLPSVDTWGSDMNILRDPPKSIMTRRIDKVGETSSITEEIDQSENRAAECILQFARGVNPSVSVSYSNSSNNGGQLSGGFGNGKNIFGPNFSNRPSNNGNGLSSVNYSGGGAASLPYKLTEAFRPPVLTQRDLQPLSRQPRIWTSSFTKPGFVDFSKKMKTCGTSAETKEVKNNILKTSARPTAVYKIETPLKEQPFEVKYMIQPFLKKSYNTTKTTTDRTQKTVLNPNKEINNNNLHVFANSNVQNVQYINNNDVYTDKYINDNNLHAFANSNLQNVQYGNNSDVYTDKYINYDNLHAFANSNVQNVQYINNNDVYTDKYINDDNLHAFANSNLQNIQYGNNSDVYTENYINDDNLHAFANSNLQNIQYSNNSDVYTENYINDKNNTSASTNIKSNYTQIGSIEDFIDFSNIKTKDILNVNYNTNISGNEKIDYIHDDIKLSRSLPEYNTKTNIKQNQEKRIQHEYMKELERNVPLTNMYANSSKQGEYNISSRQYQLNPKINPGGYNIPGQIPTQNRNGTIREPYETEKSKMGKTVMKQFEGRYMR